MNRKLKGLVLALTTACALCALAPSAASANAPYNFISTTGQYPLHVTTEELKVQRFTTGGNEIACGVVAFTGVLNAPSPELTLAPGYANCSSGLLPTTFTANGCDYVFHAGVGTGDVFAGSVDVVCPIGKAMEFHVYKNAGHTELSCTHTLFPQNNRKTVTYTDETTGSVIFEGTIKELSSQVHGACSFGLTVNMTGEYHLNATLKGHVTGFQEGDGFGGSA